MTTQRVMLMFVEASVRRILIAGVGNELMGDDALGPLLVKRLSQAYEFPAEVELMDLGLAGFDLIDFIRGRDLVIVIDSLRLAGYEPGHVLRFSKEELTEAAVRSSFSPHEPSLGQTLMAAERIHGRVPEVILFGAVGAWFDLGSGLSEAMEDAVPRLERMLVHELRRQGMNVRKRGVADQNLGNDFKSENVDAPRANSME